MKYFLTGLLSVTVVLILGFVIVYSINFFFGNIGVAILITLGALVLPLYLLGELIHECFF